MTFSVFVQLGYEVRLLSYEVAPLGYEVAPLGYEVAPLGYEVGLLSYEVAPLGYEVGLTLLGYEVGLLSYEVAHRNFSIRHSPYTHLEPPAKSGRVKHNQTLSSPERVWLTLFAQPYPCTACA